jgi:hypothetical protein
MTDLVIASTSAKLNPSQRRSPRPVRVALRLLLGRLRLLYQVEEQVPHDCMTRSCLGVRRMSA